MNKISFLSVATMLLATSATAENVQEYAQLFKNYDACFILYSINKHKIISAYNPNNRCNERISPNSTFKIPLSLMAFNQNIINQKTLFQWDGKEGFIPEHKQNQTPKSWLQYSVVWVSQQITPQLGMKRIKHYLAGFDYGNQDFSGDHGKNNGLSHAWLASSLKISALEQLNFLSAMLSDELPVSNEAMTHTKNNLYLGTLDNGAKYYGKTGSGRHGKNEREENPSLLRDGWFVGFIEQGKQQYVFVSNLTDKKVQAIIDKSDGSLKPFGSQILKPITMQLLNEQFSKTS